MGQRKAGERPNTACSRRAFARRVQWFFVSVSPFVFYRRLLTPRAADAFRYTATMRFEWAEQKNKPNIRKHGLDFADAWEIFIAPMLTGLDDREGYGEDRQDGTCFSPTGSGNT